MLAFAFSNGQAHFDARTRGLVDETNAIAHAYRSADLLAEPARSEAHSLLRQFVALRVSTDAAVAEGLRDEIVRTVQGSEQIHDTLWSLTMRLNREVPAGSGVETFTASVLELINTNTARVEAALYNRIPRIIWFTLLLAGLSMLTMGYQAGLSDARSHLATWTLAVAFSAVMVLIMDLDRPIMTLFDVNSQIMLDLQARMGADAGQP